MAIKLPIKNGGGSSNADELKPPSDWADISSCPVNEAIFLISPELSPTCQIFVDFTGGNGNCLIDWGDETIVTAIHSVWCFHSFTRGTGTPCSEGYTTRRIKIYNASTTITNIGLYGSGMNNVLAWHQNIPTLQNAYNNIGKSKYLRYAWLNGTFNDTYSLKNAFMGCFSLQRVIFNETMNSVTSMESCFENSRKMKEFIFPKNMENLLSISNCFNYSTPCKITLPENAPNLWDLYLFTNDSSGETCNLSEIINLDKIGINSDGIVLYAPYWWGINKSLRISAKIKQLYLPYCEISNLILDSIATSPLDIGSTQIMLTYSLMNGDKLNTFAESLPIKTGVIINLTGTLGTNDPIWIEYGLGVMTGKGYTVIF